MTNTSPRPRVHKLPPRWQHLIEVLHASPLITLDELASILDKRPESVLADISQMRKAGVPVETVFSYGDSRYHLAPDEPFSPAQTLLLQLTMCLNELSTPELQATIEAMAKTIAARTISEGASI